MMAQQVNSPPMKRPKAAKDAEEEPDSTEGFRFSQEPSLDQIQWRGEVKEGLPDWSEKDKKHLSQELSDVLIYLVRLAEKCQVDLPAATVEKIKLNKQKYPAHQVYGSSKKYTEYATPEKNSS
ncbi:DCTPP1 [Branchiostoma lanceolatum]|uniref:dCTP pyrophosphatase 1 n=1 Tax=Branchiostoma lanceolatum TaxID=7740 RepID=A0A8J9YPS3_BRALA|nr:DCTPP1 [Branchiostoma lanceolatum]